MQEIIYNIPSLEQEESHDCVQTSAAMLLSHYGTRKSVSEIKAEVPVYINAAGKPLGSSVGHMASYFLDLDFKTTVHTSDAQLFDQSWKDLSPTELIANIQARQPFIKHAVYDQETLGVITNGFVQFLQKGGQLVMPVVDEAYLHTLLEAGPIFCVVNYQYLFEVARTAYDTQDKPQRDPIQGQLSTHVVTIAGYKDSQFLVIDSVRKPDEAQLWVPASRLIAAYHLADIDLDSLLITIAK